MLQKFKKSVFLRPETLRGRAVVARRAHNPEVAGSSPAPATKSGATFCDTVGCANLLESTAPNTRQAYLFVGCQQISHGRGHHLRAFRFCSHPSVRFQIVIQGAFIVRITDVFQLVPRQTALSIGLSVALLPVEKVPVTPVIGTSPRHGVAKGIIVCVGDG